ncbi:hypothetical protein [uncultured Sphingomonas sp.]|uniref:hypothetical protein n=1 Tax=uncultured Sphingomonas sp. TaxID=158754 RepID=UPI0026158D61|nr:hypothetical protein [uncultured Sphingomonas sp.]
MNGIFSRQPCQSSIRLLVGTHLLLLVQSTLVLRGAPDLGASQMVIWLTLVPGVSAFICAVLGETSQPGSDYHWRRRNGR